MYTNYPRFKEYAKFLFDNHLDALVKDVISRAQQAELPVLKLLSHLSKEQLFDVSKQGLLEDVIRPLLQDNPFGTYRNKIEDWKKNNLTIPKDKLEIKDITNIHYMRKASFVSFIRTYGIEPLEQIALFEELDHFFSHCIDLGLAAYEEIQRGELIDKNHILNGLLANLPVIVTRLDRDGLITQSIGSGVKRLGLSENQTIGYNFLGMSPEHAKYINKAYTGESVSYIGAWEYEGRTYFFENYFFLEDAESKQLLGFSLDITERIETQEKLFQARKSDEQRVALNNLFMQVPALLGVLKGKEGVVELFNPAFSKLWGNREVVGKKMREAWPELEGQGYFEFVEDVYRNGAVVCRTEYPANIDRNNNGILEEAFFNFVYQPYFGADGKIEGVLIFGIDVTEQVRTRQIVQESEERFKTIANEAPAFVFLAGANARLEFINKTWLTFAGITLEEAMGEGSLKATHPEDLDMVLSTYHEAFRKQTPYKFEIRQKGADGNYRWVLWKGIPRYVSSGEFIGMMGIGIDIHERVVAEQALKVSQERQQLAVKAGRIGIWNWNIQEDRASYSPELHEIFGAEAGAFDDFGNALQTFLSFLFPEDRTAVQEKIANVLEKVERDIYLEFRLVRQDTKEIVWISERGEVHYNRENQPVRMLGTIIDITQVKNIEESLKAKNEELRRINSDLDNFIYTASHDLKAPISNLEGLMMALQEVSGEKLTAEEDFQEIMTLMNTSILRFKNTINELADIAKIQRNIEDDISEIDLKEVIEDVKISLRQEILNSQASIELRIEGKPTISFSKRNLRSIVHNLVSNSLKYRSPERHPKVTITLEAKDGYLVLTVADNGLGIPANKQKEVFGMFKRLHNHVDGTGVGLYIVQRILENNGGRIEVESEQGKGSTFSVYFKKA